jgi:hypothetical protein
MTSLLSQSVASMLVLANSACYLSVPLSDLTPTRHCKVTEHGIFQVLVSEKGQWDVARDARSFRLC